MTPANQFYSALPVFPEEITVEARPICLQTNPNTSARDPAGCDVSPPLGKLFFSQ